MATATPPTTPTHERVADVVARLRLSRSFVYDLVASGRVPALKAGRSVLIEAGSVERYLKAETERLRPTSA